MLINFNKNSYFQQYSQPQKFTKSIDIMYSQKQKAIYTKACGKVLIAGGYGVLQTQNLGLSLALENYFYCKLDVVTQNTDTMIIVQSPQISKNYTFVYSKQRDKLQQLHNQQNVFVEKALNFSLVHFGRLPNAGHLNLTLIFDKGFISQTSNQNTEAEHKFIKYSQKYSKTGLGSSACVVVSIVSALCQFFGQTRNKTLINVVSQFANLSAQQKIGSNFDISTAVYGTHLYKNILPEIIFKSIDKKNIKDLLTIDPQIRQIQVKNEVIRNQSVGYLIDVSKGANTRVMVSNFLKNLRNQPSEIQQSFFSQSKQITKSLFNIFQTSTQTEVQTLKSIKQVNSRHRLLQQKFSSITKTPVQPVQFKGFLDQLMMNENVLYVICPGSGGFDALFMLGLKKQSKQFYDELINQTRQKYATELGEDVNFNLKKVNIKWNGDMNVSEEEIHELQTFISNK